MEEVERCGYCHGVMTFRQAVQLAASGAQTPCEPCTCAMEKRIADAGAKRIANFSVQHAITVVSNALRSREMDQR